MTGAVDINGDPLVFDISGGATPIAAAIVDAVSLTATLPIDIILTADPLLPALAVSTNPLVRPAVAPGDTACFDATFDGQADFAGGVFDLNFRDRASNAILATVPTTLECPLVVPRVSSTQKGSLLMFSKVEVVWGGDGSSLLQDTFVDVSNDYAEDVFVQAFFINGDVELPEICSDASCTNIVQFYEPGWNAADCLFTLTANQPHSWSAATGSDKCQPFTVLDSDGPGRPDRETVGATRILRGYVIMYATRYNGEFWEEINWNHLKGDAVLVNYANGTAWEYNAWAFQARTGAHGDPLPTPGMLELNGLEYDAPYANLLLDFYGSGSTALSGIDQTVMVDTDLTVHAVSADLRQDGCGPVLTKVEADIWNEFESKFSGTRRCVCCWDQTMLSDWVRSAAIPNHFMRSQLHTDKGKARLDGVASIECDYYDLCGETAALKRDYCIRPPEDSRDGFWGSEDSAILGLATKFLSFTPSGAHDTAGMNLVGAGDEESRIQVDVLTGPEELRLIPARR